MASANNNRSASEARELLELKKQAIVYYESNGVPKKMEEVLNSMFYDKPDDAYGHLANYFEGLAFKPKITKLMSREALDSRGQLVVQTDVFCMVKNKEKLINSSLSSNETYPPDSMKQDDRDSVEAEMRKSVAEAIRLTNSRVSEALKDKDPTQQEEVDTVLMNIFEKLQLEEEERLVAEREEKKEEGAGESHAVDFTKSPRSTDSKTKAKSPKGKSKGPAVVVIPDEPREKFLCGCSFLSAVSQAVGDAGASLQVEPLFKHLASAFSNQMPEKFSMPLPMVTILMSGKLSPGKLNSVKEFMVVPRPGMPIRESALHISNIYNHCAKVLSAKTGITGKAVNDLGALWTTFDRPEQGLDLLQDAITQQQLTPGEDFHIALNCAGHEIFDYEKGKYEVAAGLQKLGDDLTDYWGDILGRYPSVIALIDPLRKADVDAWQSLAERVSDHCYVVSDVASRRPGLLLSDHDDDDDDSGDAAENIKENDISKSENDCTNDSKSECNQSTITNSITKKVGIKTNAVVLRLENMNTVSDLMRASHKLHEQNNETILSASIGESTDTFLADLAIASGARFLKLGAPCRGERVAKLNRLLQIEATLEALDQLSTLQAHVFPSLKPPTPIPEQPEEGENSAEQPDAETEKK